MSYERVYTVEEVGGKDKFCVINETSITGHVVLNGLDEESAVFYVELMNEVYNQCKRDYETAQWK